MSQRILPFSMWVVALAFFTYQFILRLWPSLMMNQLMQQFNLDATAFGLLASFYYYGYSGMQLPIAFLLNKHGAKYVISICALICGGASLAFIFITNWYLALLLRFLVGAGSAAAFLGVSNIISQWFPKSEYTKMVGYSFTIGLLGAIYGGGPISILVDDFGWVKVTLGIGFGGILIGILALLILKPAPLGNTQTASELTASELKFSDVKLLFCSPTLWILASANFLMVGTLEGFADVWGVNYLITAYGLTRISAAELISFIFIGMLFGGPVLAILSQRFGNFPVMIMAGCGMGLIFFKFLLFSSEFNWHVFAALFFALGLLCCYQVLVFSVGDDLVESNMLGVTIAFLNSINMLGGSFFHTIIGRLMDKKWQGAMEQGIKQYNIEAYQSSLAIIPVCTLTGTLMLVFVAYLISKKNPTIV